MSAEVSKIKKNRWAGHSAETEYIIPKACECLIRQEQAKKNFENLPDEQNL